MSMLIKCLDTEHSAILGMLKKDKYQNVYLYIDVLKSGIERKNIHTYIAVENERVRAIIYEYYGSLQLYLVDNGISDLLVKEICDFIVQNNICRISGSKLFVDKLMGMLGDKYNATVGDIMTIIPEKYNTTDEVAFATVDDIPQIAKLICQDEIFSAAYDEKILEQQLYDRMVCDKCKNMVIKVDDMVVAHFGVYADCDEMSVLSGLIVDKNYRKHGFAKKLVLSLASNVYACGKTPILYCYESDTTAWYERMGWKCIHSCAKMEKI